MGFIEKAIDPVLALPRAIKRAVALVLDAALSIFSVWLAFLLRTGELIPLHERMALIPTIAAILLALPIFMIFGLYRTVFRYIGWEALVAIGRAVLIYGVIYAAIFTAVGSPGVPRTIGVIQPILLFIVVGASRAFARYWLGGRYRHNRSRQSSKNVLIYGAGTAGRQLASALADGHRMRVRGFIDDDQQLQGSIMTGIRVWSSEQLAELIEEFSITDVLLAIPSAGRRRRNEIVEMMRRLRVAVRTLPGIQDLADGRVEVTDLRPLAIEDVLGRESVAPDATLLERDIRGRVVLVTGAGGSIGAELCRQIIRYRPRTLLLVDLSEFALYSVHQELEVPAQGDPGPVRLVPLLASVCDERRIRKILAAWRPHSVYHAAAYKHVPLVEHNVMEGIRNNVIGTWTMARASRDAKVSRFVLISTDKAVRPTNVMGASKRLAEMTLQALASKPQETCFSMVRFGNVLGSSGSVFPLFRKQINMGGPITVTHCEATRYFMTIPEAAQLVLQAGAMAKGGEVFVLDMGDPVKVMDLATRMVELSGYVVRDAAAPDGDIEIVITGLRPGEKLYEELLIGNNPTATVHPRIMMALEGFLPLPELQAALNRLEQELVAHDVERSLSDLLNLVPEYSPDGEVTDWVRDQEKRVERELRGELTTWPPKPLRVVPG